MQGDVFVYCTAIMCTLLSIFVLAGVYTVGKF